MKTKIEYQYRLCAARIFAAACLATLALLAVFAVLANESVAYAFGHLERPKVSSLALVPLGIVGAGLAYMYLSAAGESVSSRGRPITLRDLLAGETYEVRCIARCGDLNLYYLEHLPSKARLAVEVLPGESDALDTLLMGGKKRFTFYDRRGEEPPNQNPVTPKTVCGCPAEFFLDPRARREPSAGVAAPA